VAPRLPFILQCVGEAVSEPFDCSKVNPGPLFQIWELFYIRKHGAVGKRTKSSPCKTQQKMFNGGLLPALQV